MLSQTSTYYFGDSDLNRKITVLYTIQDGTCYLCAVSRNPSSINAAEDIIKKIQQKTPNQVITTFIDIQTHRGYHKDPGEYCADELIVRYAGNKPKVTGWKPCTIPPHIEKLFIHQIR